MTSIHTPTYLPTHTGWVGQAIERQKSELKTLDQLQQ